MKTITFLSLLVGVSAPAFAASALDDAISDFGQSSPSNSAATADEHEPAVEEAVSRASDDPPPELGGPAKKASTPSIVESAPIAPKISGQPAKSQQSTDTPARAGVAAEPVSALPEPVPVNTKTGEQLMPAVPAALEMESVQGGGVVSFKWQNLPLIDATRILVRHLEKPVHVAILRDVRVTGDWTAVAPQQLLSEIAQAHNLKLSESQFAWILEDGGQPLNLPRAEVLVPVAAGEATALPAHLVIQPVPAQDPESLARTLSKLDARRQKLLEEQQRLRRGR